MSAAAEVVARLEAAPGRMMPCAEVARIVARVAERTAAEVAGQVKAARTRKRRKGRKGMPAGGGYVHDERMRFRCSDCGGPMRVRAVHGWQKTSGEYTRYRECTECGSRVRTVERREGDQGSRRAVSIRNLRGSEGAGL